MAKNTIEVQISGNTTGLDAAITRAKGAINTIGEAGTKSGQKLMQATQKAAQSFTSLGSKAKSAASDLTSSINKAKQALDELDFGDTLGGGTAIATASAAFLTLAQNINQAQQSISKLQAMTGASSAEMQGLSESLANVYASGAGNDWGDVAQAMGVAKQVTGQMGSELENVSKGALLVRDSFDIDVNESVRAADSLMKQFGITGEEAYTLIAQGAQNGANKNGDLADTLNEYSTQFAQLGFSAEQFTGVLITGAQSGAFSIDKVGDAIKEFNIRVKDGSKTTEEGFAAIGLNADEMAQKFAAGGETAQQAFKETISALAEMQDPVEQNIAGVNLFGTQWEDLGAKGVLALANISDKANMTADTLQQLQIANLSSVGDIFDYIGRQIEVGLILPLVQEAMPALRDFASWITEFVNIVKSGGIAEAFNTMIPPEFQIILGAIAGIIGGILLAAIISLVAVAAPLVSVFAGVAVAGAQFAALGAIIGAGITIAIEAITALDEEFGIMDSIMEGISPTIESLRDNFSESFSQISSAVSDFVSAISDGFNSIYPIIEPLIAFVVDYLVQSFITGFNLIGDVLNTFISVASSFVTGVIEVLTGIINFITGVFTGDWSKAWEGIKQIFSGVFNTIKSIAENVLGGIKNMINTILDGISSAASKLPSLNLNVRGLNIPGFAVGGLISKPTIATFAENGPEMAIPIDGSQRAKNLWTQTGEMLGMFRKDNAQGMSIASSITGNSFNQDITATAKADIIVKTDKTLSDIGKIEQKIKDLQTQGKEVSDNLYTSIKDKQESLVQDINKAFDDITKDAVKLGKDFVDFKIEKNFSHLKGAEKLDAQLVLDTSDAFDKLDAYKQKFVDSTKEAQALVEAAKKANDEKALDKATALLEQRKTDEIAAEKYISAEKENIIRDFYDNQVNMHINCKDIKAEIDEAYNNLSLEQLQEVLTQENAMRLNNMEAQKEMMDLYQEAYLAAHMTNSQLIADLYGTVYDSLGENIEGLISGTISWGSAIKSLGQSLIQTVVKFYAQKLAGMMTASLMGQSMETAAAAKSTALAASTTAAWATAALYKEMVMPGTSAIALGSLAASSAAAGTIAKIPALASGGITTGAAIAMIGEGKDQEAILPLNKSAFEKVGLTNNKPSVNQTVVINALDGKSVERILKKNGGTLVKSLKNQASKFNGRGAAL